MSGAPAADKPVVLITPYLNTRAFVHHGPPPGCELRALAPREATAAVAAGEAIGGVVPVGGLRRIAACVTTIGAFGIACAGPVDSVLLFSRIPFDEFDARSRVALTYDSMSSVRLLYLLFSYRAAGRGLPVPVEPGQAAEGELVIGDRALELLHANEYPYVLDLSEAWHRHHGLPMVFARWVVRRDTPRALRESLLQWLMDFAAAEAGLLDRAANLDGAQAGLGVPAAREYLRRIRTVMRPEDLRGQRVYERDLAAHGYFGFLEASELTPNQAMKVST